MQNGSKTVTVTRVQCNLTNKESTMTKLTKAQEVALEKLSNMEFVVIPQKGEVFEDTIHTGINTTTLHSLDKKGYISVKSIYLEGYVSSDLVILKTQ